MNGKINVGSSKKVTIDGEKVKEKINLETYKGDNPLMLGSAGYTFPEKTLLKDGLQVINSVGGEDLTDTVAEQTVAVEELLRMVNRKVADHKGEGQYVWKKYEMPTNGVVSFTQLTSGTPTVLQVTASGIDLSTVDESAFVGLTGTVNATTYNFVSETKVNIGGSNWDWSYDQTTSQITIQIDIASGTWQNATIEKIYRGYVVSSDTGAFPDGGTQDGYWYKLVEEKTEWESFTASYNFPDGGLYKTNTADTTTPTLFSIATHEIYITEVTCGSLGGEMQGSFYPMSKYVYSDSGWESLEPLETPLFISLACGIEESSIGDAYRDSASNEHSVNHLVWSINGSNVALTRVGSCTSYSTTAWGISSVAIKGYRRRK